MLALLLAPFRSAFTRPTWQRVVVLVEGTLLTHGHRTITAALRAVGLQEERHFNLFHHVLSRARWSLFLLSHLLLVLLVKEIFPRCLQVFWTSLIMSSSSGSILPRSHCTALPTRTPGQRAETEAASYAPHLTTGSILVESARLDALTCD